MSATAARSYHMGEGSVYKDHLKRVVDQGVKQRWSEHLLREIRPFITVDINYVETDLCWYAKCMIGGPGELQYTNQMRIQEGVMDRGQANLHPEWMEYHAQTMVRMAESGLFLKWLERKLDVDHRRMFHKLYPHIKHVELIPADPQCSTIDDSWLVCIIFNDPHGSYRETMGIIGADPKSFLAMLTMMQR